MAYSLDDLVGADPEMNIRAKIQRSKVFSRILAYINLKKRPVRVFEVARDLMMDPWLANRNLQQMVDFELLTRKVQSQKVVLYMPVYNSGRMLVEKYMDDVKKVLGLR